MYVWSVTRVKNIILTVIYSPCVFQSANKLNHNELNPLFAWLVDYFVLFLFYCMIFADNLGELEVAWNASSRHLPQASSFSSVSYFLFSISSVKLGWLKNKVLVLFASLSNFSDVF